MTWAGSWPEPEPWTIDTLSSLGMSARMIRLYSGTYRNMLGFARTTPSSISGTNCCGSLRNFLTPVPLWGAVSVWDTTGPLWLGGLRRWSGSTPGSRPRTSRRRRARRRRRNRASALRRTPRARAGRASPWSPRPSHGPSPTQRGRRGGGLPGRELLLERVHRGHERVEQRLVAHVGVAALLDAFDRRAQGGHDVG